MNYKKMIIEAIEKVKDERILSDYEKGKVLVENNIK